MVIKMSHPVFIGIFLALILISSASSTQDEQPTCEPLLSQQEIDEYSISVSDIPSRDLPGYRRLQRMLITGATPPLITALKAAAPEVEFVALSGRHISISKIDKGPFDAVALAAGYTDTDAVAVEGAAWLHTFSAGVDKAMAIDSVATDRPVVTSGKGYKAPAMAEHAITLMMMHARQMHRYRDDQLDEKWKRGKYKDRMWQVSGKTMLVLGLGATGTRVAKLAHGLGMSIIAVRNSNRERPEYVEYVGLPDEMVKLAPQADVVVNTLPLTSATRSIIDREFFQAMKETAIIVNVGRGETINTQDLVDAMNHNEIAGAGLDVIDPEPLPASHPLWSIPDIIITPHVATQGKDEQLRFRLLAENVRRYQAGEPLLNLVNIDAGY